MKKVLTKRYFPEPIEFDWDEGNSEKNWARHHVSQIEAESAFFNSPRFFRFDSSHSKGEDRFICLGKTKELRHLFISYTIRDSKVRIISARDMTPREFEEFRKYEEKNS